MTKKESHVTLSLKIPYCLVLGRHPDSQHQHRCNILIYVLSRDLYPSLCVCQVYNLGYHPHSPWNNNTAIPVIFTWFQSKRWGYPTCTQPFQCLNLRLLSLPQWMYKYFLFHLKWLRANIISHSGIQPQWQTCMLWLSLYIKYYSKCVYLMYTNHTVYL